MNELRIQVVTTIAWLDYRVGEGADGGLQCRLSGRGDGNTKTYKAPGLDEASELRTHRTTFCIAKMSAMLDLYLVSGPAVPEPEPLSFNWVCKRDLPPFGSALTGEQAIRRKQKKATAPTVPETEQVSISFEYRALLPDE